MRSILVSVALAACAIGPNPIPPDAVAPVPGTSITFSQTAATSVQVSWGAATDDETPVASLQYQLVVNGAADGDFVTAMTTKAVTGLAANSTHTFEVVVRDLTGNTARYVSASVTTVDSGAPVPGTGITFSNVTGTSMTVSWGAASDVETPAADLRYRLVRSTTVMAIDTLTEANSATIVMDLTAGVTSFDVTGLSSSTQYVFAVVVQDGVGNEALYAPASQQTLDITPPMAGAAVTFSMLTSSSVTVSWGAGSDNVGGALQYRLQRDGVTVQDFTVGFRTANITGLSSETEYTFVVTVRDVAGNETQYAPASVTTLDPAAPVPGTDIVVSAVTQSSLTLTWGAASGGTGVLQYQVVHAGAASQLDTLNEANAAEVLRAYGPTLTYAATGLTGGTNHAFTVIVRDAAGREALYDPVEQYLNASPVFTSSNTFSVAENTTVVGTVTASDDMTGVTFSIVGGADASAFQITTDGQLTFVMAPNFEGPGDDAYEVSVQASDGMASATQAITVNVTDVNEPPTVTSATSASIAEGTTAVMTLTASDPDAGTTSTYAITGGTHASLFQLDGSALRFTSPATPGSYQVIVQASDGSLTSVAHTVTVTVNDVQDPPVITSPLTANVAEKQTAVMTVTATDADAGSTLTFSVAGGADAALFSITSGGVLTFGSAPDFESPADASASNVYEVTVQVSDGTLTDTATIAVMVTNVNEAPAFTSAASASVSENVTVVQTLTAVDPDGDSLTFTVADGLDAALFQVVGDQLRFATAQDYEDAGGNTHQVLVAASDGMQSTEILITVSVTDVNEAPEITSGASFHVDEGDAPVTTVTATDPDALASVSFAITGGMDAALFTINNMTGQLSFVAPPAYTGIDDTYEVEVSATDGTLDDSMLLTVTVDPAI